MTHPWLVACDGRHPDFPFGFACLRCGAKEPLPPRLPVHDYRARALAFLRRHAGCEGPRQKEAEVRR